MKRIISVLLAIMLLAAVLTACGNNHQLHPDPIDKADVKTIDAMDSIYSDYIYYITDEEAIAELVEMYNGLTYEPLADGEEAPELLADKLYLLSFHTQPLEGGTFTDPLGAVGVSPKGYIMMDDGKNIFENVYRLTSSFDEERLREILTKYDANPSDGILTE